MNRRRLYARVLFGLAAFIGLAVPACAENFSLRDAEDLVMAQLVSEHRNNLPGLVLSESPEKYLRSYWVISVDWNEPNGSGHFGFFAVDRTDGDVWDGTSCNEFHSPQLASLQERLRRANGIGAAAYARLRRPGPYCG